MKAINIRWDVDRPHDLENLPKEIEIPNELLAEDIDEYEDAISDYISDITGFCHYGFDLQI